VGIGQADNLPGITGIGENFLVTGEAGIENDFPAPAGPGSRCASMKYSPVFKRKRGGLSGSVRQRILLISLREFMSGFHFGGGAAEMDPKWLMGQ
jgi:hypothetical protein